MNDSNFFKLLQEIENQPARKLFHKIRKIDRGSGLGKYKDFTDRTQFHAQWLGAASECGVVSTRHFRALIRSSSVDVSNHH